MVSAARPVRAQCAPRHPLTDIKTHSFHNFVSSVVAAKFHISCPDAELCSVTLNTCCWIVFVAFTCQMKYSRTGFTVKLVCLPVARQPAADSDDAAQHFGMGKSEPVIQRAGLGKPQQKDSMLIRDAFIHQQRNHFQQGAVMNRDRFLRMKIREPAKTESQRSARLFRLS